MKLSDVDAIHKAGLITEDQRRAIVAHFELDRESNKLLAILSVIGAVLVSAGIILLISSNWDAIPRLVKLAGGLALLGGAHAGGWFVGRDGPASARGRGAAPHRLGHVSREHRARRPDLSPELTHAQRDPALAPGHRAACLDPSLDRRNTS